MDMIMGLFSPDNYIHWVEFLTIAAIATMVGYFLAVLNVFKRD